MLQLGIKGPCPDGFTLPYQISTPQKQISEASYSGGTRNWKVEYYYNIMSKSFNELEQAGGVYALSEEQKINKL